MKKGLKILCALALFTAVPTVLASCDGSQTSEVDETQEMLNNALKELSVSESVSADFSLVVNARGGVTISWASNNEAIKVEGASAKVTQSTENDVDVVLTATATKDSRTATRNFTVKVLKKVITTEYITIPEALNAAPGTSVTVRGVVTQKIHTNQSKPDSASGFYISTTEGSIYCFGSNTANKVERGDDVIIKGNTANYPTTLTYTTQLSQIDLVDTIAKNVTLSGFDTTKFAEKTVAALAADLANESNISKTYLLKDIRINKYVTDTYTTINIYDWNDSFDHNAAKVALYSGSGSLHEYDWIDSSKIDQKVNVLFTIQGKNSKGTNWRGAIVAIL